MWEKGLVAYTPADCCVLGRTPSRSRHSPLGRADLVKSLVHPARDGSGSASNLTVSGRRSGLTMGSAGQISSLGMEVAAPHAACCLRAFGAGAHLEAPDDII